MTTRANAPAITEDTIRRFSAARSEPEWLLQRRLQAWQTFESLSMPDPRDEEWRRTDISGLDLDGALAGTAESHASANAPALKRPAGESKLVYCSLSEAARDHRDLLEPYLQTLVKAGDWKLQALEAALHDGAFIYLPRNAELDTPLLFEARASGKGYFPRLVVVAEENSSLTLANLTSSDLDDEQSLVSGAVEVFAKPNARVRYLELQQWGRQAYAFNTIRARLEQGAELTGGLVGLGAWLARTKLEVSLVGEGARAELLGLTFGDADQHFDYSTLQDHLAPRTSSDLLFKAALDGRSSEVWYGTVRIHKQAGQSDANQSSRNLLLSDHAKAAPIPVLEIEAYDVLRCSHGATAGPLDEDQRFYLESRGIPPAEAEQLLVDAFFVEVLDRLPDGALRTRVEEALARRLGRTA